MRSSPVIPEQLKVCRQCQKTCLINRNFNNPKCKIQNSVDYNKNLNNEKNERDEDEDGWQSFMLMGLSAININPAAHLVKIDPFAAPVPKISVVPPTPEMSNRETKDSEFEFKDSNCNCSSWKPEVRMFINFQNYASPSIFLSP